MKLVSSKLFFYEKTRHERCPECGSKDVIKWGAYNKLKSPNRTNKKSGEKTPLLMQITDTVSKSVSE